jgi:hypothetical protein
MLNKFFKNHYFLLFNVERYSRTEPVTGDVVAHVHCMLDT